jgi:hypothetical protein
MDDLHEGTLNCSSIIIQMAMYNAIRLTHITKMRNKCSDTKHSNIFFLSSELQDHHISEAGPISVIKARYET